MGNRRLGRKRLESVLKQLTQMTANSDDDRAGQASGPMPPWRNHRSKYFGFADDFLFSPASLVDNADAALTDDVGDAAGGNIWRTNVDGTSDTITLDNGQTGGVMKILHGSSDNEETHMTALNHGFRLDNATSPREVWFNCRIKTSDISGTGFYIGLGSAAGAEETDGNDIEDGVGFYIVDGDASAALKLLTSVGDSETSTDLDTTVADDTWLTLSWHFDGTNVNAYVNGTKKASTASDLPTDDTIIFPAIHVAAREGAANTISVDYIEACMER